MRSLRERRRPAAAGVQLVNWNPRRPVVPGRVGARLPLTRPVNNFGDLIGPFLVDRILRARGLHHADGVNDARLLTVGSVLHLARTGDVIWGSGVNGKISTSEMTFDKLDVRAVRGPLTRAVLTARGLSVPEVFGDPALLLPRYLSAMHDWAGNKRHPYTVVPNLNDFRAIREKPPQVLDPQASLLECLERIATSEFVVGSSLHSIIVAESLGIPARAYVSAVETDFKYRDYYAGTGRAGVPIASDANAALEMGGAPGLEWDGQALVDAFPVDLWQQAAAGR